MRFLVHEPCPALAPFVDSIWLFEAGQAGCDLPHARERVMPNGSAQLLVDLADDEIRWYVGERADRAHVIRGAALGGPSDRPIAIDTRGQQRIAGVSFRPGGLRPFVAPDVVAVAGAHVSLEALWGRDGATLRERLLARERVAARRDGGAILVELERVLVARIVRPLARDPLVDAALVALERGTSIRITAESIGVSEKTLLRRFTASVGLSPKRWARVRRLQRVLVEVSRGRTPEGWARIAAAHGYADHAHLVHEFRELAGITPTEYRPRSHDAHNHVPIIDAAPTT